MGDSQGLYQSNNKKQVGFALGIGLTLIIALVAKYLAGFPFLSIMGQLVIAILIGIIWRATVGVPGTITRALIFPAKSCYV